MSMNRIQKRLERSAKLWEGYAASRVSFGETLTGILAEYAEVTDWRGARVLDVGCGGGQIARAFATHGACVTGIEVNYEKAAAVARRSLPHGSAQSLRALAADAHRLPFGDHAFDLVILADVLEHVRKPAMVVQEVARVLRPGGMLYASMPNRYSLLNLISDPHYQVPAVGLMPRWMAAWYVVKLLRITDGYRTEKYFSHSEIIKLLERSGMPCEELKGQYERRIRCGDMSKSPSRQWITWVLQFRIVRRFALYAARTTWFRYFIQPGWEFVALKSEARRAASKEFANVSKANPSRS
jgi:2-polyprenyl-3-methyl-5-hydroxy-6-metoxy-1,4-benzoquinol methylase